MLKIENTEVLGWEHAIRGMRNPMNSWEKSDSYENYSVDYEKDETTGEVAEIRFPYYRVGAGDLNLMKKVLFQGHEFDREHMAKELGDIAWYLAISADAIGYDLETIFQMNIDKLKPQYPDSFDTEQSQNRAVNDI